jgi:hypothetical protein
MKDVKYLVAAYMSNVEATVRQNPGASAETKKLVLEVAEETANLIAAIIDNA